MTAATLLASALALAWLGVRFALNPAKGLRVFAVILAAPLFLKFTPRGVELGDLVVALGGGQTLPLSLLAVVVVLTVAGPRLALGGLRLPRSPQARLVAGFCAVNVFAFAVGFMAQPKLANALFLGQTLAPTVCYYIGLRWVTDAVTARRLAAIIPGVVAVSVFLEILCDMLTRGVLATLTVVSGYIWWLPIYGAYDYFPLVVAVAYGLALCLFLGVESARQRLAWGSASVVMLSALFVLHSKGALLTAGLVTVLELALFFPGTAARRRRIAAFVLFIALLGAAVALGPGASTVKNFEEFLETGARDPSSRTRFENLEIAVATILSSPLVGAGYVAATEDERTGGVARIANPHNQYLTYGVRAGLPALLMFAGLLVIAARRLRSLVKSRPPQAVRAIAIGLFSVVTAVTVVSNLLQDNFTQPYSGCLLWFLLGVAERLCLAHSTTAITGVPRSALDRTGSQSPLRNIQ